MKNCRWMYGILLCAMLMSVSLQAQHPPLPTGNARDFKVKTCLHSISYSGLWRGQSFLSVDDFLVKAKELGYENLDYTAKEFLKFMQKYK